MPSSLTCRCIGTPNARMARANLPSSSREDATATVLALGSMCHAFPLETMNCSLRSKISMQSLKAAGSALCTNAVVPIASIVRSSTKRHKSTLWLTARWSQGPMRTIKKASVAKLLPARMADKVATASDIAPFNSRCLTKAKVSSISRNMSAGKFHRSPASQTSSSLTYSNAFARSIKAAADSSPRAMAASVLRASLSPESEPPHRRLWGFPLCCRII